jgi:hypothetical protein
MLELVMSNCSAILGKADAGKVLANGETKPMRPTMAMLAHFFLSGQFNGFLEYPGGMQGNELDKLNRNRTHPRHLHPNLQHLDCYL